MGAMPLVIEGAAGCFCGTADQTFAVQCSSCSIWFHSECMGVTEGKARALLAPRTEFTCIACSESTTQRCMGRV